MAGDSCSSSCRSSKTMVFPCSGGSDVGLATDRVGRYMTIAGMGKMSCLAGVGARLTSFIKSTNEADSVIVIDGCNLDCAARCLREAGCNEFVHVRLSELGCEKGATQVTDELVTHLAEQIRKKIPA